MEFDFNDPETQFEEFERFAEFWCGPHQAAYRVPTAQLDDLVMPDPLRWFFAYGGRWPHPWSQTDPPLAPGMNMFCTEDNLSLPIEPDSYTEGLVVFGTANQGYCRWATTADNSADAPVYGDSGEQPVHGERWDRYATSLREFLLRLLLRNCCALRRVSAGTAAADKTRHFASQLVTQPLLDVRWADHADTQQLVLAHDSLVTNDWILIQDGLGNGPPIIGARTDEAEAQLQAYLSIR